MHLSTKAAPKTISETPFSTSLLLSVSKTKRTSLIMDARRDPNAMEPRLCQVGKR